MTHTPTPGDLARWPVYPDGIEGVLFVNMAKDLGVERAALATCFVCGEPMPSYEESVGRGEMCWGVPGRGVAHGGCYQPENDDG